MKLKGPILEKPDRPADDWTSRSHVHTLVLMASTACGLYLCYRLAEPFLPSLAWALALAVLFAPLQRGLESWLGKPTLAAVVAVIVIGLMVIIPAVFVAQRLTVQAAKGSEIIKARVESGEWRQTLAGQPRLIAMIETIGQQVELRETVQTLTAWLSTLAGLIVKRSAYQVIGFCLTLYLLFFFLRDRRSALQSLRWLSPLSHSEMDYLFHRVNDTICATIYGTLSVAAIQGFLGGLMFWWLGIEAPLLWGVVMALLAVVPVMGAFVVWIPVVLYLAAEGSWGKALILALWGLLIVGTVDNLLRPIWVGSRLKLHTVLVFISMVGGLLWFGPGGLILGPLVLTVTTALLEIWSNRTGGSHTGSHQGPGKAGWIPD